MRKRVRNALLGAASAALAAGLHADPGQRSFPIKLGAGTAERQALVCKPAGNGPFAAVIFNHGSIVDMLGWPGANQRGYRLDRVCERLAVEGFFAFAPIREPYARGRGFQAYEDVYRDVVLQALEHVKTLPEVDASRVALVGFSMGGLVTFKVSGERDDLRAVALLAPAAGRGLIGEFIRATPALKAPMLVMVEESDAAPILRGVAMLEKNLSGRGKPLKVVRHNRGGGHELYYDVGYWWEDLGAFLREHLGPAR